MMSSLQVVSSRTVSFRARWGGGNSNNGTNAGAFYTNSNNAATNANSTQSVPLRCGKI